MKKLVLAVWLLASAFATMASGAPEPSSAQRDLALEAANQQLVVDFYQDFFTRHNISAAKVITEDYRQHNPAVPDGKAPFVNYFTQYFKQNPHARSTIVRSAAQGDLVYLHVHSTESDGDRGQAIVDIFRVANGKIVEHWDVIQAIPQRAANSNTMF